MPAIPDTSAEEPITGIKGFDSNLRCRGFQFEVGKTYEHTGAVVVCDSGFHAISGHPLEVFQYYPPAGSRYAETTQSGALGRHSEDSKVASAKITINAELHIPQIVERAIAWVLKQTISTQAQHTVIDHGAASSTGDQGAAMATGYDSRVMGAKGNALFLVLRDDDGTITHAWAGIAGRKGIKPTTWYSLGKDGKPFEVAP